MQRENRYKIFRNRVNCSLEIQLSGLLIGNTTFNFVTNVSVYLIE